MRNSLCLGRFGRRPRRGNLEEAKAQEKRTEAEAQAAEDTIADEVWHSYSDIKPALRQRSAAGTLLQASSTSYAAALESYKYGVRNILDVLSARRSLAQARSADIGARAQVLTTFADLAYRTADLLRTQAAKSRDPLTLVGRASGISAFTMRMPSCPCVQHPRILFPRMDVLCPGRHPLCRAPSPPRPQIEAGRLRLAHSTYLPLCRCSARSPYGFES